MIRYVVAIALVTALLAAGFAALEEVATLRGETAVEGEITTIENAAVSLLENDDPVPGGGESPRRVLEIDLPEEELTSGSVDRFVFEPIAETDRTAVRYRFDGRSETTRYLDAPLVNAASETERLDLSNSAGRQTLILELVVEENRGPVVQVSVR